MPTKAAVVTGTLDCTTIGNTVNLTVSGFGTPTAAILVWTDANTTNNPQDNARASVGFWCASGQRTSALSANNASATTATSRGQFDDQAATAITAVTSGTDSVFTAASCSSITDGVQLEITTGGGSVSRYVTAILIGGTTNVSIGTIDLGTGTSAIDITAPGFRPDLVFFSSIGLGTDADGVSVSAILSFGAAHNDGTTTTQGMNAFYSGDALSAATVSGSYTSNNSVVGQVFNDAVSWTAAVSDFDASGFSITPSANAASDFVYYLALELADPGDAYVGVIDSATSTGDQANTSVGFQPDVLGLAMTRATAVNTVTQIGTFAFGASDGTTQSAYHVFDEDAAGTSVAKSAYNGSAIASVPDDDGTTDPITASLSSLDATGWTLNYSAVSTTARKWLAFAIGDSTAGGGGPPTLAALTASNITTTGARLTVTV